MLAVALTFNVILLLFFPDSSCIKNRVGIVKEKEKKHVIDKK
jgi:hypothetical protein